MLASRSVWSEQAMRSAGSCVRDTSRLVRTPGSLVQALLGSHLHYGEVRPGLSSQRRGARPMRKPQTQDDRRVSLMARDQYVRSVKWTPCAQEGEEEHLLQRLEQGNVERHKMCPDVGVCQNADAARER